MIGFSIPEVKYWMNADVSSPCRSESTMNCRDCNRGSTTCHSIVYSVYCTKVVRYGRNWPMLLVCGLHWIIIIDRQSSPTNSVSEYKYFANGKEGRRITRLYCRLLRNPLPIFQYHFCSCKFKGCRGRYLRELNDNIEIWLSAYRLLSSEAASPNLLLPAVRKLIAISHFAVEVPIYYCTVWSIKPTVGVPPDLTRLALWHSSSKMNPGLVGLGVLT